MTSTTRIPYDFYPTHDRSSLVVKALTDRVDIRGTVLEPCAGDRDLARHLESDDRRVFSTDIRWNPREDATLPEYWRPWKTDWVVTNPPFNQAGTILEHAFDRANIGVAFLLRLSFLEPTRDRVSLLNNLSDHQILLFPVSPRIRFRSDVKNSDSVTVAWFVWRKDFSWKAIGVQPPFQFERIEHGQTKNRFKISDCA